MTQTVLHNQSLLDFSIQHTGTVENCFKIAVENGLSVTDDLTPGMSLEIPADVKIDKEVLNYYSAKQIKPATALGQLEIIVRDEGIGFWEIGTEFIVN